MEATAPVDLATASPSDPTAVFGRRVLAAVVDLALILIPTALLFSAAFEYHSVDRLEAAGITPQELCDQITEDGGMCIDTSDMDDRVYFADDVPWTSTAYLWGSSVLLLVVLQGFTGWSPGKLLTGVRVVQEDGAKPGLVKALLRWLLWIVDGFPWIIPGLVGFIVGLSTPGHRRVGDMAAGTYVVGSSSVGRPVVVPAALAPPPPATWGAPVSTIAPVPPPAPAPTTGGPQWDAARGTYIQWDPGQSAWVQWDDATRAWTRIPGQ